MKSKCILLMIPVLAMLTLFTGCVGPKPIKTTLNVEEASQMGALPPFEYASEKDVLLTKREIDPETGITYELDFKALASAAAYAQAERETVDAQARVAQAEALRDTAGALAGFSAQIFAPQASGQVPIVPPPAAVIPPAIPVIEPPAEPPAE